MEHQRFDYSPIIRRPPLKFPNGARVAVWIVPNVEHYHYDKPAIALTPMTTALKPDVLNYAWRDYGARVGIWRLMEILDRNGFRATAALNSEVALQYPQIIEEGARLGWEWMAHGANNSSLFTGMPPDVERGVITQVLRTIEDKTGKRPRGWLGPALTETDNTLDMMNCPTRCAPRMERLWRCLIPSRSATFRSSSVTGAPGRISTELPSTSSTPCMRTARASRVCSAWRCIRS
jgi:allantoinase